MISQKNPNSFFSEHWLAIFLVAAGALFRFICLGETSLSNDELSAITRARFNTLPELFEFGIKPDGHPPLAQLIIYYSLKLFGDNVFMIRLPFAIAGVLSVWIIYLLARKWFGSFTALLSAAALSLLHFPVLYSQLARPYSLGLLFIVTLAYSWDKIALINQSASSRKYQLLYVVSMTGAIYSHYFSALSAALLALTGLFFVSKKSAVPYLLCNLIPFLLFAPYLRVFLFQLSVGGIGFWLPLPEWNFFLLFTRYVFNDSAIIAIVLLTAAVVVALLNKSKWNKNKYTIISLILTVVPFIIGYAYSLLRNPVLQFSSLYFALPFYLMVLFSVTEFLITSSTFRLVLTLFISVFFMTHTFIVNGYYSKNHFGVFKEIAEKKVQLDTQYGKDSIASAISLVNPQYLKFYFDKFDKPGSVNLYMSDERLSFGKLAHLLDSAICPYFLYAWTNVAHFYETIELIQQRYPVIVERDTFFNSEIILFRKDSLFNSTYNFIQAIDFEAMNDAHADTTAFRGKYSQLLNEQTEYSQGFDLMISGNNHSDRICFECYFNSHSDSMGNASIVTSFESNEQTIAWYGYQLNYFRISKLKWQKAIICPEIPNQQNTRLKAYIWNPDKAVLRVDELKLYRQAANPIYRK